VKQGKDSNTAVERGSQSNQEEVRERDSNARITYNTTSLTSKQPNFRTSSIPSSDSNVPINRPSNKPVTTGIGGGRFQNGMTNDKANIERVSNMVIPNGGISSFAPIPQSPLAQIQQTGGQSQDPREKAKQGRRDGQPKPRGDPFS
jgi:hypothetical protein